MNHAARLLLVPLLLAAPASAQVKLPGDPHASDPVGIVAEPCPSRAEETDPAGRDMRKLHQVTRDWAQLCRYHRDNAAVRGQPVSVVFMGDSITDGWIKGDPDFFKEGRIDRGIGGQTTPQMLVRFREDVIALKPKAVHIMAGTNDIAGNTGPLRLAWTEQNIASMVELARAHGIRVLLASVPPARAFDWRPGIDPRASIAELNAWLRQYAAAHCLTWVDYHAVLADGDGGLRRDYTEDGVHPTRAGYEAMQPVLERALAATAPRCPR